jgi:hypothetical protein
MTRRAIKEPPVERAMKRWPKYGHLPAIVLLIVLTLGFGVTAVRAESGTITVSGNPPQVANLYITFTTPGANVTHIVVDTQYTIMLNATDPDTLNDIRKIDLQLYTDSFNDTGDIKHHYNFAWTYNGTPHHFANVSPSGSYLDETSSTEPTLTLTKGVFQFVFKLNKLAIHTKAGDSPLHWTVMAYIYDNNNNYNWLSNTFDVDLYQSLTIDSSVTWTGLAAGTTWNLASNPNPGTWTYTSNAIAKIQMYATTPTNAYGNTFPVGNIQVAQDSGHTTNLQAFTGTAADWLIGLPNNADQGESVYWFVDIPAGQPTGTYTFSYYASIAFDDYAT